MMHTSLRRLVLALGFASSSALTGAAGAQVYGQFPKDELPMIQRSVLPGTTGKMGSIAYDPTSGCTYIAAPRSGQLEVMDNMRMSTLQSIKDLQEPQGVCVASEMRKLILTCGDGAVKVYSIDAAKPGAAPGGKDLPAGTLIEEKTVRFPGEADPIRWDAKNKRAVIGHGKFVSWLNPATGEKSKPLDVGAPVKALAVENGSDRLFASIPSKGQIVIIDRTKWEIVGEPWTLKDTTGNAALSLDEQNGRLWVACRNPAELVMLNSKDGKETQRFKIGDDAQDCWWDVVGQRVYVSSGGGNGGISMIWNKQGTFVKEHQLETAPGARTSLLVPEKRQYIVCAPSLGGNPTFVYIYVLPNAMEHHEATVKGR